MSFQIVLYHFISKPFENRCRYYLVLFLLWKKWEDLHLIRDRFLQWQRAGNFCNFCFPNSLFCLFLLLILGLFSILKNQQGQGRPHQWRSKVRNLVYSFGCSTCILEKLVTFGYLKAWMEKILCYCRRIWRKTVAQGRIKLIVWEGKFCFSKR